MKTLYSILLSASGLSQREAAIFHGARLDTVKSWSAGRNAAPAGAIQELVDLIDRMMTAVDAGVEQMEKMQAQHPVTGEIELGLCSDDHEAQSLGWPSASVHSRVIGLLAAEAIAAGHAVKTVPRGSTVATAAAIDAHHQ